MFKAEGTTLEEEAEGMARTRYSSKSFCSGDLYGGGEEGSRGEGVSFCLRAGFLPSFCLEFVWRGV